jgi:hypothetical protein
MNQPTVCAVMLVNGREAMVRRAIWSFREQTYQNKRLLIWDSTPGLICCDQVEDDGCFHVPAMEWATIGELRNDANGFWNDFPILMHWDSDDWSHRNRIAEQVALLQSSGKQCVGYRDMLFWKTELANSPASGPLAAHFGAERAAAITNAAGEAWLYSNPDTKYCLGTSLCYWRSVWEQRPFPDLPKLGKERGGVGEDVEWLRGVDSLGVASKQDPPIKLRLSPVYEPRMIASIHGDNTQFYDPAEYVARERGNSWKRAPEWDNFCGERMAL